MIPVVQTPSLTESLRRVIHSINFSEDIHSGTAVSMVTPFTLNAPSIVLNTFPGIAVDRLTFRKHRKDARWVVYAAGMVETNDANAANLGIAYIKNDGTLVQLAPGATSFPAAGGGWQKAAIGPFDVFATAPNTEQVVELVLTAQKAAGLAGNLYGWTLWIRLLASKQ